MEAVVLTYIVALIVGIAVTNQIVEVVRHSDSQVFTLLRGWAERVESSNLPYVKVVFMPLIALLCPWCTSVWAGLLVAVHIVGFIYPDSTAYTFTALTIFTGLALSRLSNLMNDMLHKVWRTPNRGNKTLLEMLSNEEIESEYHKRGITQN